MNLDFPEPTRSSLHELTHGIRIVGGKAFKLEFWNSPHGMQILQINPERPWVTGLAKTPITDLPESERFK